MRGSKTKSKRDKGAAGMWQIWKYNSSRDAETEEKHGEDSG